MPRCAPSWYRPVGMLYYGPILHDLFSPALRLPGGRKDRSHSTMFLIPSSITFASWAFLASAVLLALFGTAMAISFGLKSPLDYSVFSASGAATLLALDAWKTRRKN